MIKITNTVTGKREFFKAQKERTLLLYVCGITPYDTAHIGHARCYVTFDLVNRFFQFMGYEVIYCRNITDIDDKLLVTAQKQLGDPLRYSEIADRYIAQFANEMDALNCLAPTYEPRVTDNIAPIITFIERLIEQGCAYVAESDVYFDIRSFVRYGMLSKQKIEDLCAGARVQINEKKRDPLDFALWKGEEDGTFWLSPWGYGRPGWHIECSALAATYLGESIDIHAGGMDLIFPHHENEIAQSEALFQQTFAHYWMHNGLVQVDGQKMSKSLGNFVTIADVLKTVDPMVFRFYLLSHHYRAPFDFSFHDLRSFEKSYNRLAHVLCPEQGHVIENEPVDRQTYERSSVVGKLIEALADDFNTSALFAVLFTSSQLLEQSASERRAVKAWLADVMGLIMRPLPEKEVTRSAHVESLLLEREQARAAKDFKRADEIRDELRVLNVEIQDAKI